MSLSFQQNSINLNANNTHELAKNDSKNDHHKASEKLKSTEESLTKIFFSPQEAEQYAAELQTKEKLETIKDNFKKLTLELKQSSLDQLKDFESFCEQYENENFYSSVTREISSLKDLISKGIKVSNNKVSNNNNEKKFDEDTSKILRNMMRKRNKLKEKFLNIKVLFVLSENTENAVHNFLHNEVKVRQHQDQLYEAFQDVLSYIRSCIKNNKDPVFDHMPFIKNFIFSITNLEALKNFAIKEENDDKKEENDDKIKRNFVRFILRNKVFRGFEVMAENPMAKDHLTPEKVQNIKEKMTPPSLLKQVTSKLKSFIPFWKN